MPLSKVVSNSLSLTTLTASSTLTVTGAGSIQGLTVGLGAGAVATNTAVGASALAANTSGGSNTAIGRLSLFGTTTGTTNTALGNSAAQSNTIGSSNVAVGDNALFSNTTASNNTAVGYQAGYATTTGFANVYVGNNAGDAVTTASGCVFVGTQAGGSVTTGVGNTIVGGSNGTYAGNSLTTGTLNNFFGTDAGGSITTGSKNTLIGTYNGNQGGLDIRTASNHIVLSDGDGNPRIQVNDSGRTQIVGSSAGNPIFVANNNNGSTPDGIGIQFNGASPNNTSQFVIQFGDSISYKFRVFSNGNVVNSNNSYGSISDIKLKENVVDATPKLDKLMQVRVVNYNLIADPAQKQLGVIAQELEQVFPGMINVSPDRDAEGNTLETTTKSVKYSVFVPMLIKAIQEQQALITQLQADVAALKGQP